MTLPTDFSSDNLLTQATCTILIEGVVKGTAWLVSNEGHLLTAGHILGTDKPRYSVVEVCFTEDVPRRAYKVVWGYQREMGFDYAVLKLVDGAIDRQPLPISLAKSVEGTFRLYGFGKTLQYLSAGKGTFIGSFDWQNSQNNRVFLLDSKQLGEGGYSGAAVFSDELQAVVAIQTGTTQTSTGHGRDTIIAMPLYRIPQVWNIDFAPRKNYMEWRLEDVENRLNTSIHGTRFIDLGLTDRREVVMPFTYKGYDPHSIKTKTFTCFDEVFKLYKQRILLLGVPGSGKTTSLLYVARRLLQDALENEKTPIPILFNLSQWEFDEQSIADWLIMLTTNLPIEGISIEVAQSWINEGKVALLLDGLDEVDEVRYTKLVTVLNEYLITHPKIPIVICSRIAEYDEILRQGIENRLHLEGAVVLQPLSQEQIEDYLIDARATTLRDILLKDAELYELAQIPLTLSMMTLAYGDLDYNQIPTNLPLTERRHHLFDTYIDRMIQRKARRDARNPYLHTEELNPNETLPTQYNREEVNRYLGWLAIRLTEQAHTVFPLNGIFRFLENSPDQGFRNTVSVTNSVTMLLIGIIMAIAWFTDEMANFPPILGLILLVVLSGGGIGFSNFIIQRVTKNWPRTKILRLLKIIFFISVYIIINTLLDNIYFGYSLQTAFTRVPVITLTSIILSGAINGLLNKSRGTVRGGGLIGAFVGLLVSYVLVDKNLGFVMEFIVGILCGLSGGMFMVWYSRRNDRFVEGTLFNSIARILLIMQNYIPQDFEAFLHYATDALLLKRAGAEFEFVHRLLRDHFALRELMLRLRDPDVETRLLTIERLSHLGETALEALQETAIHDEDSNVRHLAKKTMGKITTY